jgi:hypothetical protein
LENWLLGSKIAILQPKRQKVSKNLKHKIASYRGALADLEDLADARSRCQEPMPRTDAKSVLALES